MGYVFYTGSEAALPARTHEMPAVWLMPPTLKAVGGRMERRDTYTVKIRFMMLVPAPVADNLAGAVAILEVDAMTLAATVEKSSEVRKVTRVRITSDDRPSTPRGEAAATMECEVEMFYCKY